MGGKDMNELEATELRLGLPGTEEECDRQNQTRNNNKRSLLRSHGEHLILPADAKKSAGEHTTPPPSKAQVVGWPPVRSYRKNCMQSKKEEGAETGVYLKVSMDGAPYLRKIHLNLYKDYSQLLQALQLMFNFKLGVYSETQGYNGSEYVPTYQDKDGDWMLVGDVPWDMFTTSCNRLRIMKASEAKGLGCAT